MSMQRTRLGAVVIVVSLVAIGCGSKSATTSTSSSSTASSTTISVPGPSTTTTAAPTADTAVWPFATSATRYAEPVEAARTFAESYLGYVAPVMGPFQQGDSRSGEVTVQAKAAGPVTTVIVRQLAPDDTWWVLGASTPTLQLESPTTLATISSPVTLAGQSTAFEATVNVEIRQDGTTTPLAADIVMGGSNGQMGPFSKAVTFGPPQASAGAIVVKVLSAEDGAISEASVIRVRFG